MNEPQREQPPAESPPPVTAAPPHAVSTSASASGYSSFVTTLVALFGVVLPAFTLGFELILRWCTTELFDPVPTIVHMLLVGCVPVANLLALIATSQRKPELLPTALFLNGMALGVSSLYTLIFLPLVPVGLIGLIFYGLGLLPLSPVLSLSMALVMRSRLKRAHVPGVGVARPWLGVGVALGALLTAEAPVTGTRLALHAAVSGSEETQRTALQVLRRLGDEELLLSASYVRPQGLTLLNMLLSWNDPVTLDDARRVYYQVTGQTFNSVPWPENLRREGGLRRNWDFDQAGRVVGGRVHGLSLASSELKGSVDGDAALAYLEWTMSFQTTEPGQSEARTQLVLPPGAVISRVTLYIDGQEREAAFAGTEKVREAYEAIVRRAMDPLLVTQQGKDRVQVQCFPVVKGPPMKIKLGFTVPLLPKDDGRFATLLLPVMAERNFHIPEDFRHAMRIESLRPLSTQAGGGVEQRKDGVSEWLAALEDKALQPPQAVLTVQRKGAADLAWAEDPSVSASGYVVRQQLRRIQVPVPERILLVLDGSREMKEALPEVAAALGSLPQGTELAALASLDGVEELLPLSKVDAAALQRLAERVKALEPVGGQDASAALARAWSMVAPEGRTVVVWIHGSHPLEPAKGGRASRGEPEPPAWWYAAARPDEVLDVMVGRGPNRMAVELAEAVPLRTVPRTGTLEQDLKALFTRWGSEVTEFHRDRLPMAELSPPPEAWKTSSHLARLWARDEVWRMLSAQEQKRAEASELAARYQLVTEVSGAVVLERQSQYDAAGLEPVDPGSVPSVPEPATWMLMGVACLLLVAFRLRRAS